MELPNNGMDVSKLWVFVAAHVEDDKAGKPCPLAMKAWRQVPAYMRTDYKSRTAAGLLPSSLPERGPERLGSVGKVGWSSK
jgi:hypothetical protein